MGNAIAKKFDVPKDHMATAGHSQLWKIWPGKSKETGELVSIWAFDKNDLAKRKPNPVTDKAVLEQIFQIMKKDFTSIKEAKSCTSVIQYLETIEDSKNAIVFTTERIVCSLADSLHNFDQVPGGYAGHEDFFEFGGVITEMEISRGLLELAEGLQYLHTVQRKLHMNITPENIVITSMGQWKLCGFGFNLSFAQGDQPRLASPYYLKASTSSGGIRLEPDLRYAAPECTDGGYNPPGIRYVTPSCDAFSLGIVIYEVYRYFLKLVNERTPHRPIVTVTNNDALQHHFGLEGLKSAEFTYLPFGIQNLIIGLLQMNLQIRSSIADIINCPYFVAGEQATLNMIDNLASKDIGTQSSQLISLQSQLGAIPVRILTLTVLPSICKLCVANASLWMYALPLHVTIARQLSSEKYQQIAGASVAIGLQTATPNEAVQAFLNNVEFLAEKFDRGFFQANVVTLFCNALEKQNSFIQTLALVKLEDSTIRSCFNADSLSERLIPKVCKEACKNPEPNIKIEALYILSLFCNQLDKQFLAKNILPSLKYITDNEKHSGVSMCVVGNYEAIADTLGTEYIANSILPSILPMLADKTLDKSQFEIVVNLVKSLLKKILDGRAQELAMLPIGVGEMIGTVAADPFSAAKTLLATAKAQNAQTLASSVLGSNGGFGAGLPSTAPPVPGSAPPPPPSMPPPASLPPPPPSKPAPAFPGSAPPSYGSSAPPPIPALAAAAPAAPQISSYQSSFVMSSSTSMPPIMDDTFGAQPPPLPAPAVAVPSKEKDKPAASSGFSWFGSSSKTTAKKDEKSDYAPPLVPATSGSVPVDDTDDFLASFGKQNTLSSSSAASTTSATSSAPLSFGSSTGGWNSGTSTATSAPPKVPTLSPPPSASAAASSLSIEEQIRQTQEQIAKLNSTMGAATAPAPAPAASTASGFSFMSAPPAPAAAPAYSASVPSYSAPATTGYSAPAPAPAPVQTPSSYGYQQPATYGAAPAYGYTGYGSGSATAAGGYGNTGYTAPATAAPAPTYGSGGYSAGIGQAAGYPQPQGYSAPNYGSQQPSGGGYGAYGAQGAYGAPAAAAGYGQQPAQYGAAAGSGYGVPQFGSNLSNSGYMGSSTMGAAANTQQQSGGWFGGASQPAGQQRSGHIGNLPAQTGYQPPGAQGYAPPAAGGYAPQTQQQKPAGHNVTSAFDFLN